MDTPVNTINITSFSDLNDHNTRIPRGITTRLEELNFWKYETKMIVVSGICFVIASGCIILLIIDRSNCALNNAVFSVLGSIVGLMTGIMSNRSGSCASSRNNSV